MSVETDDTNYADIETFESVEGIIRIGNSGAPSIADLSPNSDWKSFPQLTYNCCYGLPYQDHNYGAPPPPTPPPSPGSNALVTKNKSFKIALESLKPNKLVPDRKPKQAHRKATENRRRSGGANSKATVVKPVADESKPVVVTNGEQLESKEPSASGDYSDSVTRCICDFDHDDGYMICCDQCQVWQHIDCMGIDRQDIPEEYSCEQCMPRRVYKARARLIQKKKRDDIFRSSSEDENANTRKKPSVLLKSGQKAKYQQRNKKSMAPLKKSSSSAVAGNKKKTAINTIVNSKQRQNKRQVTDSILLSVDGDTDESPWEVPYESATANQYSTDIEESLKSYKSTTDSQVDGVLEKVANPLCQLRLLVNGRRGLEVDDDVTTDQPLIEFKGKVMLQQQFIQENNWLKRPQPFVLFYDKWDNLEICVDATSFGNEARFVRRSCVPNAEVRHVIEKGEVHLVLFAVKDLPVGSEVTIPFDLDFRSCDYEVECACSRAQCPVRKAAKKVKRTTSRGDGDHVEPASQQTPCAKKAVHEKLKVEIPDNVASDNQLSSGTGQGIDKVNGEVLKSPKEEKGKVEESRRLSREDRKIEAYMKAFEKMEKREERRKELLQKINEKKESPESANKRVEPVKHSVKQPAQAQAKAKTQNSKTASQAKQICQSGLKSASQQQQGKSAPRQGVARRRNRSGPVLRRRSSSNAARHSESHSEVELDENSNQPPCESSTRIPAPGEVGSTATGTISDTPSFRFPKTKKHLLNEWYSENGLDKCSIDKPLTVNVSQSDNVDFVKANSSPGSSWAHLRRNSVTSNSTQANHTPITSSRKLDISMGSAKKRWLKQAMEEDNSNQTTPTVLMSPSGEQASTSPQSSTVNSSLPVTSTAMTASASQTTPSPNAPTHCTNNHTSDFVTPLKKRRLARESISLDSRPTSPELVTELVQPKMSALLPALEEVAAEGHSSISNTHSDTTTTSTDAEQQNTADGLPETACAIAPQVNDPVKPAMVGAFSPDSTLEATGSHEDGGNLTGSPQRRHRLSEQETESSSGTAMLSPREPRTLVDLMQHTPSSNVEEYATSSAERQSVISPCSIAQIPTHSTAAQRLHKSLSESGSPPSHMHNHTSTLPHSGPSIALKRSFSMMEDTQHSGLWNRHEHVEGKQVHGGVNHGPCGNSEYAPVTPPSKKKVSLLEYRKRMQVQPMRDNCTPITTAPVTPPFTNKPTASQPSLTLPALPLFDDWKDSSGANGDAVLSRPPLSLDERLQLEFGLSTSTPEKTRAVRQTLGSLSPPPPPPISHRSAQHSSRNSPASVAYSKLETSDFSNKPGEKMAHSQSRTSEMNGHSDDWSFEGRTNETLSSQHQDIDGASHRHGDTSSPEHIKKPNRALKQGSLGAIMLGQSVTSALPSRDISGSRQLTQFDLPKKYR